MTMRLKGKHGLIIALFILVFLFVRGVASEDAAVSAGDAEDLGIDTEPVVMEEFYEDPVLTELKIMIAEQDAEYDYAEAGAEPAPETAGAVQAATEEAAAPAVATQDKGNGSGVMPTLILAVSAIVAFILGRMSRADSSRGKRA